MSYKIKDLLREDANALDYSELKDRSVRLQAEANKRYSVQKGQTYKSPAWRQAKESGGRFNITKQENYWAMKKEYFRALRYLSDETSTQAGFKNVKRRIRDAIEETHNVKISLKNFDRVFDVFEELAAKDPTARDIEYKYNILEFINVTATDINFDELYSKAEKKLNDIYKEEQRKRSTYEHDISSYFR